MSESRPPAEREPTMPVKRPSMIRLIAGDLVAKAQWCHGSTALKYLLTVTVTDGTFSMLLYRLMQASTRMRLAPLAMIFNKINSAFCHCVIGRRADFGAEFVLIHSQGVVIHGSVRGGDRVFIEHQVTIGAERDQTPVLGNDVFLGAGAKIVGAVTIGDGARVGANAVVIKDVPPYSTVVGIPAKVVRTRQPGEEPEGVPSSPSEDR